MCLMCNVFCTNVINTMVMRLNNLNHFNKNFFGSSCFDAQFLDNCGKNRPNRMIIKQCEKTEAYKYSFYIKVFYAYSKIVHKVLKLDDNRDTVRIIKGIKIFVQSV